MTEMSAAEILILNVDCIFGPLYYREGIEFEECQAFVLRILKANGVDYSLQQLLESNLPALILEVLMQADAGDIGKSNVCRI